MWIGDATLNWGSLEITSTIPLSRKKACKKVNLQTINRRQLTEDN